MSVKIKFERYCYPGGMRDIEAELTLGPFDWVEVEGDQMVAGAEDGNVRHDPLATFEPEPRNWHWVVEGYEGKWHYYVIEGAA